LGLQKVLSDGAALAFQKFSHCGGQATVVERVSTEGARRLEAPRKLVFAASAGSVTAG